MLHFKKNIYFSFILLLSACSNPFFPSSPNTYTCDWTDSVNAYFYNVYLQLPCDHCDIPFNSSYLSMWFPCSSFYDIMYRIKNNPGVNNESCSFDWSVTLCNKECLNNMQTSRIYLNQDNFQNRLFNGDILETSPMIHNSNITPYDYKHQIKFQIYNVYNEETDEYGTLTWTKNWLATSNDAMWLNSYWQFICINNTEYDSEQTYMSFNPNRNLGHRYIYIHNHFEWN